MLIGRIYHLWLCLLYFSWNVGNKTWALSVGSCLHRLLLHRLSPCRGPKTWINFVYAVSVDWLSHLRKKNNTQLHTAVSLLHCERAYKSITHLHVLQKWLFFKAYNVLTLSWFVFCFSWSIFLPFLKSLQVTDLALCNSSCGLLKCSLKSDFFHAHWIFQ